MSDIQLFQYEGRQVRTVQKDDKMWFVGRDVAEILGYSNPQKAVRDHCKRPEPVGVNESFTLDPQTIIIPEGDVYRLIARSNMPNAEMFESWVMDEVLPSIRKTGSYSLVKKSEDEMVLETFTLLKNRVEKQKRLIEAQREDINRMEQKEVFFDAYLNRDGYIEISDAGKIFSTNYPQVGPNNIFPFLVALGVLWKDRSGYHAYQNHISAGRFFTDDSVFNKDGVCFKKSKTYATSKGMTYIHGLLSKKFGNGQKTLFRISA